MHNRENKARTSWGKSVTAGLIACALACPVAGAARSPAGTQISNVAAVSFEIDGAASTLSSNRVAICVAEILDVALSARPRIDTTASPFTLANEGNGPEAFLLQATATGTAPRIVVDTDHNGRFDAAIDTIMIDNGLTSSIAAGGTLALLVLADGAANDVTLTAQAATGNGAAGTTFTGKGEGGCDAVVGNSAGKVTVQGALAQTASDAQLIKSQQVTAPDGSSNAVSGATITYTLAVVLRGGAPLKSALVNDPIPTGTDYVPGSITLDGTTLADAGRFDGAAIQVAIGDIDQPGTRTVTFQVKIK